MYWFRRTTCPTLTNLKLKLLTRHTHQLFVRLIALKPVPETFVQQNMPPCFPQNQAT